MYNYPQKGRCLISNRFEINIWNGNKALVVLIEKFGYLVDFFHRLNTRLEPWSEIELGCWRLVTVITVREQQVVHEGKQLLHDGILS